MYTFKLTYDDGNCTEGATFETQAEALHAALASQARYLDACPDARVDELLVLRLAC